MSMSPEARAAQSERMKEYWAKKANGAEGVLPSPTPQVSVATPSPTPRPTESVMTIHDHLEFILGDSVILIQADWEHVSMSEGQKLYQVLRKEFERAGGILNSRSLREHTTWTCFTCKKEFTGIRPAFTDFSYVDPETKLIRRIECCSERCVILYNEFRINERRNREIAERQREQDEANVVETIEE